jgi:hypothetical protein
VVDPVARLLRLTGDQQAAVQPQRHAGHHAADHLPYQARRGPAGMLELPLRVIERRHRHREGWPPGKRREQDLERSLESVRRNLGAAPDEALEVR